MPISAWIMLGFGCLVLYGGLGVCILIAVSGKSAAPADSDLNETHRT